LIRALSKVSAERALIYGGYKIVQSGLEIKGNRLPLLGKLQTSMESTKTRTCTWTGASGSSYTYYIFPVNTSFEARAGNYIFCRETSAGRWSPQYIGQAGNLGDRLADHDKEACAKQNGATHVHARLNPVEADRLKEEKDLILRFQPPCNETYIA